MSKPFRYGTAIGIGKGNAVLDAGSFKPIGPSGLARAAGAHPRWSSNFLLVGGERSATGHPLFVGGPQIGYVYPGLTLEADIAWPGGQARGATSAGLCRQHPDRPRAGLCVEPDVGGLGPDRHLRRDAVRRLTHEVPLQGPLPHDGHGRRGHDRRRRPGKYRTTVHGPVTGYAKVGGKTVAVSRKRASYGQDVLWQLAFRDLTTGKVRSVDDAAARRAPFAVHVQRRLRRRPGHRACTRPATAGPSRGSTRACRPRAPASTSGAASCVRRARRSRSTRRAACSMNWNNRPAPGWGAADDNWAYGYRKRAVAVADAAAVTGSPDFEDETIETGPRCRPRRPGRCRSPSSCRGP